MLLCNPNTGINSYSAKMKDYSEKRISAICAEHPTTDPDIIESVYQEALQDERNNDISYTIGEKECYEAILLELDSKIDNMQSGLDHAIQYEVWDNASRFKAIIGALKEYKHSIRRTFSNE